MKKIKRRLPTIVCLVIWKMPTLLASRNKDIDLSVFSVVCSIAALIAFTFAIFLDENWHFSEALKFRNMEKLDKLQGIIILTVFYGMAIIGHVFNIPGLIPFYVSGDKSGLGIVTFVVAFLVTGVFTLVYKLVEKIRGKKCNKK